MLSYSQWVEVKVNDSRTMNEQMMCVAVRNLV